MNNLKFKRISIIVFLIIFISGSFITLDWARLFIVKEELKYNRFIYTYIAKFLVVILSTIIVFLIGKDGFSRKDTARLKLIYIFIILADISLVAFRKPYMGIALFSIVQLGLILRNSSSILNKFKIQKSKIWLNNLFINILLTAAMLIIIIISIANKLIKDGILLYISQFYIILITISLLTAIAALLVKAFPKINSILITIGMFCFLLCDLNVGLTIALDSFTLITDSIVWMFYTPALTLIALSGYNYGS